MKKAKTRKQVDESQTLNKESFIARAEIKIYAPSKKVWDALVNSGIIRQYMFNTNAISDRKEGSSIMWRGEWQGKPYEDRGVILRLEPERLLRYSHFSLSCLSLFRLLRLCCCNALYIYSPAG